MPSQMIFLSRSKSRKQQKEKTQDKQISQIIARRQQVAIIATLRICEMKTKRTKWLSWTRFISTSRIIKCSRSKKSLVQLQGLSDHLGLWSPAQMRNRRWNPNVCLTKSRRLKTSATHKTSLTSTQTELSSNTNNLCEDYLRRITTITCSRRKCLLHLRILPASSSGNLQ